MFDPVLLLETYIILAWHLQLLGQPSHQVIRAIHGLCAFDSAKTASWECDGGRNPVLPLFEIRHYAVGTCTSWFTQPLWSLHEIREISTGQARAEGQVLRISDFRLLGTYRHREAGAGEGV